MLFLVLIWCYLRADLLISEGWWVFTLGLLVYCFELCGYVWVLVWIWLFWFVFGFLDCCLVVLRGWFCWGAFFVVWFCLDSWVSVELSVTGVCFDF